jgi:hypothetical protein
MCGEARNCGCQSSSSRCDCDECDDHEAASQIDELNIARLQNTNHELKSLIHRLDNLSESVDHSIRGHRGHHPYGQCTTRRVHRRVSATRDVRPCSCSDCGQAPVTYISVPQCTVCHIRKAAVNSKHVAYDYSVCEECDRMTRLAQVERARIETSLLPTLKYEVTGHRFCDDCDACLQERLERRERARSRSRARMRYLSRSRSRGRSSSEEESPPDDLPRPAWNGGPYKQYYDNTEWKLKHQKK